MRKAVTWDELASLYDKHNDGGRRARTLPMSVVADWARSADDLIVYDEVEDLFYMKDGE